MSEGVKYDQGKPRMDLLDSEFLQGVSRVLTFGAEKYGPHNWREGINYSRVYAAIQRHLCAFNKGEDVDSESGISHIYHAACGLMFLSWYLDHKKEFDDRFKY